MDWRNLQLAVELSKSGTIAGAARGLGLTAASVAKRLDRLSDELGATAFDKTPSGWLPTIEMSKVLDTLLVFDDRVNEELFLLERSKTTHPKQVLVAVPPVLQTNFLFPMLATFSGGDWQHRLVIRSTGTVQEEEADIELEALPASHSLLSDRVDFDIEYALYRHNDAISTEKWVSTTSYENMLPHDRMGRAFFDRDPSLLVEDCQVVMDVIRNSDFAGCLPTMVGKLADDLIEIEEAGVARCGFNVRTNEKTNSLPEVVQVEAWIQKTLEMHNSKKFLR